MNFNGEEYKSIREARLALLSVGDPVYYITYTNHIETFYVVEVLEDGVIVDTGAIHHPLHHFDKMETYEGKLYICGYMSSKHKLRLRRMIKVVKSNERRIRNN